ncbi:MAG: pilus assembly PilX N-terminal domain-containing protein, partial [Candidatus Hydrogenedentes bacterium]|nr:pilus assembly PilX N-terminal domain-containing protein [Candidatus Hydrogenedentota bacterium]
MTNRIRSTNDPWGGRAAAIEARAHRAVPAERGAALILAIGVLSVLIIISLTFWQSTRQEMQTATNTANSIRAELLTDGAFAIAIAFLNHDLAAHPSYTSLDHAWRTYFNGAWAVGKPWLWAPIENESGDLQQVPLFNNPAINRDPETLRGVPGIPEIPTIDGLVAGGFTMDRSDANYFGDNIYIPRILINPNTGVFEQDLIAGPFVVSSDLADSFLALAFGTLIDAVYPTYSDAIVELVLREPDNDIDPINEENDLLPDEQIHFWTDVDNDGDGLNDSMWLPIGGDLIFDADGIDNNLNNGPIINSDGIDNNLDGFVDDGFDGIDERGETAVFLYDGTADGLDNDRDGAVDEPDEQRLFLTTRIFDLVDGDVNDLIDLSRINTLAIWADRREELGLDPIDIPTDILDAVDALDNNFDLKVNGVETFVVRPAAGPFALDDDNPAFGYHQIASQYLTFPGMGISVFSSGETVTEIVGRVAILITDEASKVNINA